MICSFILLMFACNSLGYGYDSGGDRATCGRSFRTGRIHQAPCDLEKNGYCTSAGKTYPWRAVKRFISDNQGLVRRMYGDQRHGHVLKAELHNDVHLWNTMPLPVSRSSRYQHNADMGNDLFPNNLDTNENDARLLHEEVTNDVLNTKFVFSEEPPISIKLVGLKTGAHVGITTQKTTSKVMLSQTNNLEETTEHTTASKDALEDIDVTTEIVTDQTTLDDVNDTSNQEYAIPTTTTTSTTTTDSTTPAGATLSGNNIPNTAPIEESNDNTADPILFQDTEDGQKKRNPINYNTRGINACPVKEEVIAPFWANNTRGEVLALLNMYPFEQYVHWEKCTFEHRQMHCKDGCRCEQQYRLHRLLAYDPNNECRGIFSDWFRFPSCCICMCYGIPLEFRVTSRSPRFVYDP